MSAIFFCKSCFYRPLPAVNNRRNSDEIQSLGHGVLIVMTIELLACLWLAPIVELGVAEPSLEKNAENTLKKLYEAGCEKSQRLSRAPR